MRIFHADLNYDPMYCVKLNVVVFSVHSLRRLVVVSMYVVLTVQYIISLLGHPTLVGKTLRFSPELSFFLSFLSIHRAQQPCGGRPSNVFRRFGRR